MYVRFQSPHPGKRGVHTGVFGLTNLLGRSGRLTVEQHRAWRKGNEWYDAAYPDPSDTDPSVYDETVNPQATAWFKISATHLLDRVPEYLDILRAHGGECERVNPTIRDGSSTRMTCRSSSSRELRLQIPQPFEARIADRLAGWNRCRSSSLTLSGQRFASGIPS